MCERLKQLLMRRRARPGAARHRHVAHTRAVLHSRTGATGLWHALLQCDRVYVCVTVDSEEIRCFKQHFVCLLPFAPLQYISR